MSALSLRIPNSIHKRIRNIAKHDGVSINQFITIAVSEKVSALLASDYISQRAKRATREKFENALSKVPNSEPETFDKAK